MVRHNRFYSVFLRSAGLDDARRELARVIDEQAVLQFGGAAGTLASFGAHAPQLTRALADGRAWPNWVPGDEFRAIRDKSRAGVTGAAK